MAENFPTANDILGYSTMYDKLLHEFAHMVDNWLVAHSGPYITFSMWVGGAMSLAEVENMHGYPAAVHCRGIWGHAPP